MVEYISRDDVLEKAKSSISVPTDNEWDCGYNTAMAEMKEFIKQLPSADVQPVKRCRMIPLEPDCRGWTDVFICTNCHQHIHLGLIRKEYSGSYCLECGAEVKDGDTECQDTE